MSIRYKFFLLICALFTLVFSTSLFLESIIHKKAIRELKNDIVDFYTKQLENKHQYIDNVVRSALQFKLVEVNAILNELSIFSLVENIFAPTEYNIKEGTWKNAVRLLQTRENMDFIQNTFDSRTLSLIEPLRTSLRQAKCIPSGSADFVWTYFTEETNKLKKCYVGIPIELKSQGPINGDSIQPQNIGPAPVTYFLYDVDSVLKFPLSDIRKKIMQEVDIDPQFIAFFQDVYLDLYGYLDRLERVQAQLKAQPERYLPPEIPLPNNNNQSQDACDQTLEYLMKQRMSFTNQLFTLWKLSSLLESGISGPSWNSPSAPVGAAFFIDDIQTGEGFFVSEVISESELFDAEAYYENSKKIAGIVKIADGTAVFTDPKRSTVYLGNVAKFDIQDSGKNLSSYLTLAFELENVINQLSLSYAQTALIIVGNKVVSSIQPNKHIGLDINISEEDIRTIIGSRSGKLNISDREDYYITVKPFPSVDLTICLLTPFDVEYALFNDLQNKLESLNVKITLSKDGIILLGVIMVVVLVFNFTKKITKPIIAISAAARTIQNGALDQVVLPTLNFGVSNEVQILNNAFKDMVEGLKEKERVKGILDKVVSQDIAKEILKQGIKLGGEERKATIFFADIRGFTRTTQNMDPSDVIKMLNECMTRLSKIIELHHGVIDKYVGDEVMVLFGAPIASDNAAINAVVCGLEIIKELNQWNVIRTAEGLPQVMMGIGIHTGLVFAGNMGAENRLNYTVIGSNVNLAARLCGAAGPGEILISNATRNEICVRDEIEVDDLGLLSFKGFDGAEQVFRVKGIK